MSATESTGRRARVRVALIQMRSADRLGENLDRAEALCREAAQAGAELILLPENFAYLALEGLRVPCAEPVTGPVVRRFAALARETGADVLLGSIPEAVGEPDRHANTSVLIGRDGEVLATYRKIHLFDVDLPGLSVRESDAVVRGRQVVTADLSWGRIGLSICYDLRFGELYRGLGSAGADVVSVPAAFTAQTGPDHWAVLLRARAIENQVFVLAPAQWGHHGGSRRSHGHSLVIDPWGRVLAELEEGDGVLAAELDLSLLDEVRAKIPCQGHRQPWLVRGDRQSP
jgi:predicted amidohydrolase